MSPIEYRSPGYAAKFDLFYLHFWIDDKPAIYHPVYASADQVAWLGDKVISSQSSEGARAHLLDPEAPRIYQDQVNGRRKVVFTTPDGPSGSAFFGDLDGVEHNFILEGNQFTDEATGSIWDLSGRAIEGPLAGAQLEAISSKASF